MLRKRLSFLIYLYLVESLYNDSLALFSNWQIFVRCYISTTTVKSNNRVVSISYRLSETLRGPWEYVFEAEEYLEKSRLISDAGKILLSIQLRCSETISSSSPYTRVINAQESHLYFAGEGWDD